MSGRGGFRPIPQFRYFIWGVNRLHPTWTFWTKSPSLTDREKTFQPFFNFMKIYFFSFLSKKTIPRRKFWYILSLSQNYSGALIFYSVRFSEKFFQRICESSEHILSDSFLGVFSGKILTLGRNGLIRVVERKCRVSGTCIMDDHMPQEKHVLTYNCELTLFLWPPKFKKVTT